MLVYERISEKPEYVKSLHMAGVKREETHDDPGV
jgi:hypothetical protein